VEFFLLAFPALFSIVNPLGGAFIFLGATRKVSRAMRDRLALWVAIHSFVILNVSLYVGAYLLSFFGISMPVLRVAGGIIIAVAGFRLLNEGEAETHNGAMNLASEREASSLAFYPLTMPITAGPGTISVAVALGTNRPRGLEFLWFALAATVTTALMALLIYLMYRFSDRVSRAIGPIGTDSIVRLSAFILFCIGIQVLWTGVEELLSTLLE
jgi:multiple antibiotic resistance protein